VALFLERSAPGFLSLLFPSSFGLSSVSNLASNSSCRLNYHSAKTRSVKFLHLFVLVLGVLSSELASEHLLAVRVESQSGDLEVGCIERHLGLLSVDLLLGNLLDVDAPAATVHSLDLASTALVGAASDLDGVSLAHWEGTHGVFLL